MKELDQKSGRLRGLVLTTAALLLCFSLPLHHLMGFAVQNELYSHIVLIPFISGYLVWLKRRGLPPFSEPDRGTAAVLAATGAALVAAGWIAAISSTELSREDRLTLNTLAFLLFFGAACGWFLGRPALRALAFPLGFLLFMAPIPQLLQTWLVTFLQYGTAAVAFGLFELSGTPVFRDGLIFRLPGFSMEIAPQCSGIHSSLALLITSLLAGHLFLRSRWKQVALALFVIPLALLRNGVRVFTIGQLCVHIGPEMINSYIHRHGGPIFFVLSLVPFFLLLFFLMKTDRSLPQPCRKNPGALK